MLLLATLIEAAVVVPARRQKVHGISANLLEVVERHHGGGQACLFARAVAARISCWASHSTLRRMSLLSGLRTRWCQNNRGCMRRDC